MTLGMGRFLTLAIASVLQIERTSLCRICLDDLRRYSTPTQPVLFFAQHRSDIAQALAIRRFSLSNSRLGSPLCRSSNLSFHTTGSDAIIRRASAGASAAGRVPL